MEAEKVFSVVSLYTIDGTVSDVSVATFADKRKAIEEVKKMYLIDLDDCPEKWESDEFYKTIDLENGYFSIHLEGCFMDDGYEVFVKECKINY